LSRDRLPFRVELRRSEMKLGREWAALLALGVVTLLPSCGRKPVEINAIAPSFSANRARAPLGSAIEVTYTWTLDPTAKKLPQDYRALVHFLDQHKSVIFTDDHVPIPAPSSWEPGKTYSYKRTVFIPVYPYVGPVRVVMGLYPVAGHGERVGMKGEDLGLREYKVAILDFLPQTDNIFLVYKDGWHNPEPHPDNPSIERTWTKKEALVSFKNPKKDVIVYLDADTCVKCFQETPVLTISANGKTGITFPIETPEVFLKKIHFKADDLGTDDWVDLRLTMNQSFIPKTLGMNQDSRELGLLVYHLYVGEAATLGSVDGVVEAGPVTVAAPAAKTAGAPGAKTPAKTQASAAPAKAKGPLPASPLPKKSPSPKK
jgi:hypothetical protein